MRTKLRQATRSALISALAAAAFVAAALAQNSGYDQPYRPQVHFSPEKNWTNDPNGLVYFHGEYHLFFQYNPFGDEWGHMSWGHAVSTDLLHWRQLPVAIPEENGIMIFTGSVVVDRENTSGFCAPKTECLVAVYTGAGDKAHGALQTQNLAYSRDSGRTWTKYNANQCSICTWPTSAIPAFPGTSGSVIGSWSSPCPRSTRPGFIRRQT